MNAVGIDVSKGKSMVAILHSYGKLFSHHSNFFTQQMISILLLN